MFWILILITTISPIWSQKKFGYFYMDYRSVSHPYPQNDIVQYRIQLSRVNKTYKDFSGWFRVQRKIIGLQLDLLIYKRTDTGGYQTYIRKPPHPFCTKGNFPIFRECFSGIIEDTDCSLDQGNYTLKSYSLEYELRNYVGDKTFFGDYIICLRWVEGGSNNTLFGFDINYIVKDAEQRRQTHHHPNEKNEASSSEENKNKKP